MHGKSTPSRRPTRPDLAAMVAPLGRALAAAELPILRTHDLTMWAYAVLVGLGDEPVRTQAALAQAVGADKTRIIPILDDLQDRRLISREPDPDDRRVRLVSLTAKGRRVRTSAQTAIQRQENRLLSRIPAADRRAFLRVLRTLSTISAEDITDPSA
ncbi:MAG: MarR family winged helix-turn-helix transcriptional regulator [Actinopolymorphaceae bacterium]